MAALASAPEPTNGLALAIVASASFPMLLLDGDLNIESASASFCAAFQIDAGGDRRAAARHLGRWGVGCPAARLAAARDALGRVAIEAYEIDFKRPGGATRRLVLSAQKLAFADGANVHVLLLDLRRHRRAPDREGQGRPGAREGGAPPGAAASRRQQPADHRQRPDAERAPGPVRRDPRLSARRPPPDHVGRRRCSASSPSPSRATSSCGRTSPSCAPASAPR